MKGVIIVNVFDRFYRRNAVHHDNYLRLLRVRLLLHFSIAGLKLLDADCVVPVSFHMDEFYFVSLINEIIDSIKSNFKWLSIKIYCVKDNFYRL